MYKEKPYNRCLLCPHRVGDQVHCDGPRTSSMPIERWREYMRDVKDIENLTYADIAERAGNVLSEKTIQNALAPGAKGDINRETARLIENAIFGSSSQYPCYMAFIESLPEGTRKVTEVEEEMAGLRKNIAMIHDSYKAELEQVRHDYQAHIDFLTAQIEQKDKIISKLVGV